MKVDPETKADIFLGCKHEQHEVELDKGRRIRYITYNMEDYLQSTVESYETMVKNLTGTKPQMITVPTPFLAEDHKTAPAGAPSADCPCCGRPIGLPINDPPASPAADYDACAAVTDSNAQYNEDSWFYPTKDSTCRT